MHILVTGSSGFIGTALVRFFSSAGNRVVSMSRIEPGKTPENSADTFKGSFQGNEFADFLSRFQPDYLLHCAGKASVPGSFTKVEEDFLSNTGEVFNVLDQLRQRSPKTRFLLFSSAAVYGRAGTLPISETDPVAPVSPYGFHKRSAEWVCQEFYDVFGVECLVARVFSAYGEGLKRQVCWDLSRKITEGKGRLTLQGAGDETRDFIHLDDLCDAVALLVHKGDWGCGIYNVASGVEVPIRRIAGLLCESYGFEPDLRFEGKLPPGVPQRWVADISRLARLGFDPKVGIEEGLSAYAKWAEREIAGSVSS